MPQTKAYRSGFLGFPLGRNRLIIDCLKLRVERGYVFHRQVYELDLATLDITSHSYNFITGHSFSFCSADRSNPGAVRTAFVKHIVYSGSVPFTELLSNAIIKAREYENSLRVV